MNELKGGEKVIVYWLTKDEIKSDRLTLVAANKNLRLLHFSLLFISNILYLTPAVSLIFIQDA